MEEKGYSIRKDSRVNLSYICGGLSVEGCNICSSMILPYTFSIWTIDLSFGFTDHHGSVHKLFCDLGDAA